LGYHEGQSHPDRSSVAVGVRANRRPPRRALCSAIRRALSRAAVMAAATMAFPLQSYAQETQAQSQDPHAQEENAQAPAQDMLASAQDAPAAEAVAVSAAETPAPAAEAPSHGALWSTTELQFQYGVLDVPLFAGGGTDATAISTFQHASGYSFGDFFMFVDLSKGDDSGTNHFNDWEVYTEAYLSFSSARILHVDYGNSILRDVALIGGINYAFDADVLKLLPGIRLSWNLPGFAFLNTDFMAYLDASKGVAGGNFNAPAETDSWMVDMNFATESFEIAGAHFNFEGHVEYIAPRHNEFGAKVRGHILGQPQFRWDAGETLFGTRNHLFLGIEYQFWLNKLGEDNDEHAVQFLAAWRF
jgi:hypothetical protein